MFIPSKQLQGMFDLAREEVDEGSIRGRYFHVTLGPNARADAHDRVPYAVMEVLGIAEGFDTAAPAAASAASAAPAAAAAIGKKAPAPEWRAVKEAVDVVVAAVEAAMPHVNPDEITLGILSEEGHPAPGTPEFMAEIVSRVEAAKAENHRLAVEAVARALGDEDLRALIVQEAMKAVSPPPELSLVDESVDEATG